MIAFALIRPFLPAIGLALLAGGLWWYHEDAVDDAYGFGRTAERSVWEERERIAVAAGEAQTRLLARSAINQTETFHVKLQALETNSRRDRAALAERSARADGLQQRLDAIAAAPPSADSAGSACRSAEERNRSCAGLVAEANRLAGEADDLATEARRLLAIEQARLAAMVEWARLVQSAQQAD